MEVDGQYYTILYYIILVLNIYSKLIFIYEIRKNNIFIQQGCIKLIKSDSKDIYNVSKDFYFKWMLFYLTFGGSWKKKSMMVSKKTKTKDVC